MVDILPFRGLIYNKEKIKDYSEVISPPYDVISDDLRKELEGCGPYNIVKLILPQGNGNEKYAAAHNLLENWIKEKALEIDTKNCYYLFEMRFISENKKKSMLGFIGLTRIGPYGSLKIMRHEKTLPKPRKDRYQLLKNCRVNFGLIYTLYRDPETRVTRILEEYRQKEPFITTNPCYDRTLTFKLWKISDTEDTDRITGLMKDKTILIADGHHRHETSLIYSNETASSLKQDSSARIPENYALTLFMENSQKDINIYPIYRSIKFKDFTDIKDFIEKAKGDFDIELFDIEGPEGITEALKHFRNNNIKGFIIYLKGGTSYRLLFKKPASLKGSGDIGPPILDVNIFHHNILEKLEKIYNIKNISFDHNSSRIVDDIENGRSDLGIFLNAPTIREMEKTCSAGSLMPQKSTFFWPKPCTGLVMYKFEY